jgi:Ca-activated chloride channel family protein
MNRNLPFLFLGVVGLVGLMTQLPSASAKTPAHPKHPTPVVEDGSVKVTAQLERTHLLAGQTGETYARIALEGIDVPGPTERLPVSVTIVIDRSGSMSGDKIVNARSSAIAALEQLHVGDRASVVAFGSGANVLVDRITIGERSLDSARRAISRLNASGGTDMISALDVGGARARALFDPARVNRVLLLSDGQPDTEAGLKERVARLAKSGIHTTTLGVGRDYNEDLMSKLADAGLGNYYFVESAVQMASIFETELKSLSTVVAKEAVVTIALKPGVQVADVYGWEFSKGRSVVAIPVGDIYSGKKSEILARLSLPAVERGSNELVDVSVSYHDAVKGKAQKVARVLEATFTNDATKVATSTVADVVAKTEQVRTAQALEKAAEAAKKGDYASARRIAKDQRARVQAMAAEAPADFAPAAAEMEAALGDFEEDADGDTAVAAKKAKAAGRAFLR